MTGMWTPPLIAPPPLVRDTARISPQSEGGAEKPLKTRYGREFEPAGSAVSLCLCGAILLACRLPTPESPAASPGTSAKHLLARDHTSCRHRNLQAERRRLRFLPRQGQPLRPRLRLPNLEIVARA